MPSVRSKWGGEAIHSESMQISRPQIVVTAILITLSVDNDMTFAQVERVVIRYRVKIFQNANAWRIQTSGCVTASTPLSMQCS